MKLKKTGIFLSFFLLLTVLVLPFPKNVMGKETPTTKDPSTFIEKIETEEYYSYKIEDYERNLIYSWKFSKDTAKNMPLEESLNIENDVIVTIDGDNNTTKNIQRHIKEEKMVISFTYYKTQPEEITIELDVSKKFPEEQELYLYYYNSQNDEIEFVENKIPIEEGKAKFTITKCSDYILTAKKVKSAKNNPKTTNYLIIFLSIFSFLLLTITLLEVRKK